MEASAINSPHPAEDTVADEAEAFFGLDDEDEGSEIPEEPAAAPSNVAPEAAAAMEALKNQPEVPPTPVAGEQPPADTPDGGDAGSDPTPPAASDGPTETGVRQYIVFQRVPLTEKVLKGLLAAVDSGDAPTPRVAYFELGRPEARNPNLAVTAAYTANEKALGETADLAAVSLKSFQERHIERKPVVETAISISR